MVLSQILIQEEKDRKIIRKKYNSFNSYKWLLSPFLQLFYPFATLSKSRLERELEFLNSSNNIKKPKVYSFDIRNKELNREYIYGKIDNCEGSKIGKLLSEIHKEGYSLGDSKLDNFVCDSKYAYIIDSEQAIKTNNKRYMYWDISLLLLSAGYYNYSNLDDFKSFIENFSKEYLYWQEYKSRSVKGPYSLLFLFMPVQNLIQLRKILFNI
jgi:tRNA A-37 threonylcarbamoyl transferase component Bud32